MKRNEDCPYLALRDEMFHGRERHDDYCYYHLEWCPDCKGCVNNKPTEEDE